MGVLKNKRIIASIIVEKKYLFSKNEYTGVVLKMAKKSWNYV